jgi:hypothetical protein
MADTQKLLPLLPRVPGMRYPVLAPNVKAIDIILSTGSSNYTEEVFVFGAA